MRKSKLNLDHPRFQATLKACKELIAEDEFPSGRLILERIDESFKTNVRQMGYYREILYRNGRLPIPIYLFAKRDADLLRRDRLRKRILYKKNKNVDHAKPKPPTNFGLYERDREEIQDRVAAIRNMKLKHVMETAEHNGLSSELISEALLPVDQKWLVLRIKKKTDDEVVPVQHSQ